MRPTLIALLLTFAAPAFAAPAPFFIWQSKLDGALTCAQTSPGDGWLRLGGAFRDAGCRVPY
ncbi:hypothetical protein [Pseudomonas sp. Q1-7]|uniref:hypothetical protein n=1 Tax=Pseudomonas sp. Q1-7 TaxID=3020843 RepID=UPI00230145C6|nr:hypothetical protein [Pseudomonas sp. Q1-7]